MPIEFRCPACDKLLRTADDKAGLTANCPDCGELVAIPTPSQQVGDPRFRPLSSTSPAASPPPTPPASASAAPPAGTNAGWPYTSHVPEAAQATRPCPVCGETILAAATLCRFCGEKFNTLARSSANEGLAIASLVLGILSIVGLCCYGGVPLGIAAVVTGTIAVKQCNRGEATGKGMAIAGNICGSIAIIVTVAFFGLFMLMALVGQN